MNTDKLVDYIKSLNPKDDEKAILIYGSKYKCWRNGNYIGIATWTKDENVGDSFQVKSIIEGQEVIQVYVADKWELVINKRGSRQEHRQVEN